MPASNGHVCYNCRMEKLTQHMGPRMRDIGRWAISHVQRNIILGTPFDHPPGFEEKVRDMMQEGTYWPVVLGTHKSHPAGFPPIEEAEYIAELSNLFLPEESQITGSLLMVASTINKGQSDEIVKRFKLVKPILDEYNVQVLPVLRKKDAALLDKEEQKKYLYQLIINAGNVVNAGQIPIVLPEGTVESGRQRPGGAIGDIKGMVHLESDAVAFLAQMIRKQKKEPLFFFIGTSGENKIYDPITEKLLFEAQLTAVKRAVPFGKNFTEPIMNAVVDYPISLSELERVYGGGKKMPADVLGWVCGNLLARLLPYGERGVFTDGDLAGFDAAAERREM